MEMSTRIHYCEGNNNKNNNDDDEIIMMQLEYLKHQSDHYFVNYLAIELSVLIASAEAGYLCACRMEIYSGKGPHIPPHFTPQSNLQRT